MIEVHAHAWSAWRMEINMGIIASRYHGFCLGNILLGLFYCSPVRGTPRD